jgi:pimeloyl-ACP methyl ester carboxylesterase
MLYVEVKTRSGRIRYHYTISTPKTDDASAIDPSLPVVLWFHGFAYPYVFQSQFADPLLRKFNLIVFSLRTHGETEADEFPEGYDVQDAADDVLAFMVRSFECFIFTH